MRLPTRVIRESIKDFIRGRPKANPKTSGRGGLFHDQGKTTLKEAFDLLLSSRLRFEANEQCDFDHEMLPLLNDSRP
jgi:hypothetical protein